MNVCCDQLQILLRRRHRFFGFRLADDCDVVKGIIALAANIVAMVVVSAVTTPRAVAAGAV